MTLARKVENFIAAALSSVAPAPDLSLELVTECDETLSIRRIIVDCTQTTGYPGQLNSQGTFSADLQILIITSADAVAAVDHDDLAGTVELILQDPDALDAAAATVAAFTMQYFPPPTTTTAQSSENGARLRQTSFSVSGIVCRNDDGTP